MNPRTSMHSSVAAHRFSHQSRELPKILDRQPQGVTLPIARLKLRQDAPIASDHLRAMPTVPNSCSALSGVPCCTCDEDGINLDFAFCEDVDR